ncbi:MAG: hypothetical protein H6707_09400 [Deltaproteobacteria bacterium]|nr:hypothetical protein [Deltaproteobacteria bacterium]
MSACGARTTSQSTDGGAADARQEIQRSPDLGSPADAIGGTRCVLAIRTDNCCGAALPYRKSEVDNDSCLVEVGPSVQRVVTIGPSDPACLRKRPEICERIDCDITPPPVRTVAADAQGNCIFTDECQTDADCAPGRYHQGCCPCLDGFPRALIGSEPCVTPVDGVPALPDVCPLFDCAMVCETNQTCVPNTDPTTAVCRTVELGQNNILIKRCMLMPLARR